MSIDEKEILKAFNGTGLYTPGNRFYYSETYSKLIFNVQRGSKWEPRSSSFSYVGDCACGDGLCTYFQAICIYSYWFGWYIYGNHSMCDTNPIIAWKAMTSKNN
uniref:Uncharacterized protein n=1 Tax=Strongyloides venezuelensis TaxID=75913 RepID=A0A0K0FQA5_STRVS